MSPLFSQSSRRHTRRAASAVLAAAAFAGGTSAFACDPPSGTGRAVPSTSTSYRPVGVTVVRNVVARPTYRSDVRIVPDRVYVVAPSAPATGAATDCPAGHAPAPKRKPAGAARTAARPTSDAPAPPAPAVPTGSTLRIAGEFFGTEQGVARLETDRLSIDCRIHSWTPNGVVFELPNVTLAGPVEASLRLIAPTGRVVKTRSLTLQPDTDVQVVQTLSEEAALAAFADGRGGLN